MPYPDFGQLPGRCRYSPAAERDAEEAFQALGDLAVREPTLLVEFNDGSLGVGSELGRGGTEGFRRLQGLTRSGPAVHGRDQGPVPHRRKLREGELPRRGSYRVWRNSRRHASAGRPQESPKSPQVSPRDRAARPLLFTQDRGAGLAGDVTGRPGESRSGAFESPFAGSSDSRNGRIDRDISLNPSYASLSTEQSRRDESSCTVE